jgi:hypothetical protein
MILEMEPLKFPDRPGRKINELQPNTGNLFQLHGQLFELLDFRDDSLAELEAAKVWATEAERPHCIEQAEKQLAAIDSGIQNFIATKLKEVDDLRDPLLALESAIAINKADAERSMNRALVLQNRYDRLVLMIKGCMEVLASSGFWKPKQTKKLESARGSLTLSGNGGVEPVEITDETMLPDEVCKYSVTLPAFIWKAICQTEWENPAITVYLQKMTPQRLPSLTAVREVLEKPCAACSGVGEIMVVRLDAKKICEACGGSGKAGVPGARLNPRGNHLRISK